MTDPPPSTIDVPAVADAYALGAVRSVEVVHRRGGIEVARVITDRGRFAVKTRPVEDTRGFLDGMAFERAAASADLPMPRGLGLASSDDGFALANADGFVTVHEWLDLAPHRGEDVSVWLGGVLAQMYAIEPLTVPTALPATPTWTYGPTAAEWSGLTAQSRERGRPWAGPLERALPELDRATAFVQQAVVRHPPTGFVHPDLEPRNVFRDGSGRWIVLDWDHSRRESLPLHLAHATLLFAMVGDEPEPVRIMRTIDAFCAAGGSAPTTTDGLLARRLGLRLVRLADMIGRDLTDAAPADAEHVAERLRGLPAFRRQLDRWAELFPYR